MIVVKGSRKVAVRDDNQLAAFLNNGWELSEKVVEKAKSEEKSEAKPEEESEDKALSAEEIKGMKYFALKSLAQKNGIDVADKKRDALASEIIEKLGL